MLPRGGHKTDPWRGDPQWRQAALHTHRKKQSGFFSINKFLSEHLTEKKIFPEILSSVLDDCYIIYPLGAKPIQELAADELIGLLPTDLMKIHGLE